MSIERRTADRRRRVLYSAHQSDLTTGDDLVRLREARRPSAAYGSRVRRRLRARWFSLVPVARSTMMMVAGVIFGIVVLLCIGHYASVAWPSVAYRPEIARPLRLDRPDSFGRWFMLATLVGTAGVSFLVYQLRRHRNDDFSGRYRLWRTVQIVAMLASVNVVVSVTDWGGALIDLAFGRRVALAGADWIRLVVMFGGAILALQVLAEIRRCRPALAAMMMGVLCWGITEAATWNVVEVSTLNRWVLVTSAPLLASSAIFIATVSYLRMLYREVRQIEDRVSIRDRWQRMQQSLFDRDPDAPVEEAPEPPVKREKKRWLKREDREDQSKRTERVERAERVERTERKRPKTQAKKLDNSDVKEEATEEASFENASNDKSNKRGWFRRRRKPNQENDSDDVAKDQSAADEEPVKPKKKRRFSLRLSPPSQQQDSEQESTDVKSSGDNSTDEASASEPKKGIGGWLRRKKSTEPAEAEEQNEAPATSSSRSSTPEQDPIDPDEIDWNSLSKSERRRLRKQLKRQNRAA